MLELGAKVLISYLIGSLMGSMIVGRLRGGVDIRELGSGNAGGTNALRTQGVAFALGVIVIDIGSLPWRICFLKHVFAFVVQSYLEVSQIRHISQSCRSE